MKSKPVSPPTQPAKAERRAGTDRRHADRGPPKGLRDRRVGVEPRKPDVQELDLSPSDWAAFEALDSHAKKKTPPQP
jgi:hypothetical protein